MSWLILDIFEEKGSVSFEINHITKQITDTYLHEGCDGFLI